MLHLEAYEGPLAQLIFNKTGCLPASSPRNVKSITDRFVSNSQMSEWRRFGALSLAAREVPRQTLQVSFANKERVCCSAFSGLHGLRSSVCARCPAAPTHSLCAVKIDQENKHSRRVRPYVVAGLPKYSLIIYSSTPDVAHKDGQNYL